MAGGGQIGGMGASPVGSVAGNINEQPNMGGGMANSTNSTTTQDMMGRGGNATPFNQRMGQLGLFGMGGQQPQGGFGVGYPQLQQQNPLMQSDGGGFNGNNGQQQMPAYAQDYMGGVANRPSGQPFLGQPSFEEQLALRAANEQAQPQPQQLNQLNQLMQGRQMASGGITSLRRKR